MRLGINALATQGGGGLAYVSHLLRHLGALPAHPECVVVGTNRALDRLAPHAGWTEMIAVRPLALPHRLWWEQVRLPGFLRRHGVDVLLAPNNVGLLWSTLPTVMTIQNVDPLAPGAREAPLAFLARMRILRTLTLRTARRARRVIAISDYVRQLLVDGVGPAVRVEVIPLGRPDDADRLAPPSGVDLRRARGLLHPYLLAVSTVKYNKNYTRMVEAFAAANLGDVELVIAGAIEHKWAYDEARAAARRQGVEARVRFLGTVEGTMLRALYDGALVLVFPSLLESFGLPALEGMSYGVPVVASDLPPLREICSDAVMYVDPYSVVSIATALRQVAGDASLRRRLGEAGRQRARQFDWGDIARRTLDVLTAAAEGR